MKAKFMLNESLKLNLRDQLWIMKDNKPICLYVQSIIEKKQLEYKIDYGYTYDTEEKTYYDYQLTDYLGYKANRIEIMFTELKADWFKTKEDLLKSL